MPYTASNVPLEIYGNTASFATDFGPSGTGLTNTHVSIVKVVFGDADTATRVSSADPMPVIVNGTTGSAVEVTGDVAGRGDFYVRNSVMGSGSTAIYVAVAGNTLGTSLVGVTAMVQGFSGGHPVGVSGSVEVNNLAVPIRGITEDHYIGFGGVTGSGWSAGIYPVVMTGGRRLNSSIDSVTVSGNVHLTNSGISFTLDVSAVLGVTNASENPLYVQGYTGSSGVPLTVRGENGGAVEVVSTSALNVSVGNEVSIADDDILKQLGTTGDIYAQLSSIKTNTGTIQTISDDIRSGAGSVKISQITRPSSFTASGKKLSASAGSVVLGANQIVRSGVTIKASSTNTDVIYIGSTTLTRTTSNGYPLDPGESLFLEVGNVNLIYVRSNSGIQNIHYIAS